MKTIHLPVNNTLTAVLLAFLLFCAGLCQGQIPAAGAANGPAPGEYSVVQRGPHLRVWQSAIYFTNAAGIVSTNLRSYTELQTGSSYLTNGHYADSVEAIDVTATGAQAVQSAHKVFWASYANDPAGAVRVTSPGGQQFASTVYGLSYWDSAAGSNVLIAPIQSSLGVVVGDNQVLYANAFSNLLADIQTTYTLAGLQQNIILREQPPPPSAYGLNPATTFLQVITKFIQAPVPQKTTLQTYGVSDDVQLDFGDVGIGRGTAFLTPLPGSGRQLVNVCKEWQPLTNGTSALTESVPYSAISNLVLTLPPHSSAAKPDKNIRRTASLKSLLQTPQGRASPPSGRMKMAQALRRGPGLVIDYSMLTASLTNYVFQGDTTYYISGQVDLYGAPVFEGGTVIKYTNLATAGLVLLDLSNNYTFESVPYRPVVFTSANDNTVGTAISGSTGAPSTGQATYLSAMNTYNSGVLIDQARFSYAGTAFWSENDHSHIFQHCQFVQCATNVALWYDTAVSFLNILSANSQIMLAGWEVSVDGEQMTVDSCTTFALTDIPAGWGYYSGGLTNCVLTAVDSSRTNFTLTATTVASSGSGIYQPVGAGGYYLAAGSPYRNAGTTGINSALLAALQTLTTYPPVVLNETVGTNCTLFPQAQRDTDTPDLGYHYNPLDYALAMAISNATITVLPGTALAGCGAEVGVWLYTNGIFNCAGTATSPNYLGQYNTVQEQSNTNWETTTWDALFLTPSATDNSSANFAFTVWSALAGAAQIGGDGAVCPVALQNCQFYAGAINNNVLGPVIAATNCLFQRANVRVTDKNMGNISTTFQNNLFMEGILKVTHDESGQFTFQDNFFNETSNTLTGSIDVCSNNAYVTTNTGVLTPEHSDVILTSSPAFQVGPLGQYYYPTTFSPTNLTLIHTGNELAAVAGLYHYTVTTNNTIEGTNIVSIGFHYVAVGSNGLPLDTNGDGIPDYLEDANGNGVVDSGERSWTNAADLGLTVIITQPANNSTIP